MKTTLLLITAGFALALTSAAARANDFSDKQACLAATMQNEKLAVKTEMSPESLDRIVTLLDQMKTACEADDLAEAAKLGKAAEAAIAASTQK